jgi:type IX secretion system PorP/SprF family membrane protein
MKKYLISGFCLLLSFAGFSQQAPQFTQFMQTGNIINPAMTGLNKYTDFKIGYRKQWAGLSNSPNTLFASISGQFGSDEQTLSLPVRGRLASRFVTEKSPVKVGLKHALGGYVLVDQTSPTSLNSGNLSYALHIPFHEEKLNLSFGVGLSLAQTSLDRDKLNVSAASDPGLGNGVNSKLNPDLSAGVFLHSRRFCIGYSGNFLLRNKIYSLSDNNTLVGKQKVHHYATAGVRFDLNESWYVVPTAMLKYVDGAPASLDGSLRVGYKDIIWFGPNFRNQDSFSGFLGMNLSNFLSLSYAYDYTYSNLNVTSNGSHEIILALRLVKSGVNFSRPSMW